MLTPYDELMVHQSSRPFGYVPSTDFSWDDGHFIGIFNPDEQVYLAVGLRVNPNADLIGGYAMLNIAGKQYTVRFNRCWRRDFRMQVGPFRLEVIEPLKRLELILEKNDSDLAFRIVWEGSAPPLLEDHHVATNRSRNTCEQTRYSQPGFCTGTLTFRDRTYTLTGDRWGGVRDHSWGKYLERPPLSPEPSWLPPRESRGAPRAFRFWSGFRAAPFSGFFHVHETSDGSQHGMDDWLAEPPGGKLYRIGDDTPIEIHAVHHQLEFRPGTRIMKKALLTLTDAAGGEWKLNFESDGLPWLPQTIGYHPGSWKDGGHFHTYHGSETLALEWDEFDFSDQPVAYRPYKRGTDQEYNSYGTGIDHGQKVYGFEYAARVTVTAPDGTQSQVGTAHIEHFTNGAFPRYGFTA